MTIKNIFTNPIRMLILILSLGILGVLFACPNMISENISFITPIYRNIVLWFLETMAWIGIIAAFREYLFAVGGKELRKFTPLALMYFLIIFIYSLARQMKDTLIIGAIGAEGSTVAKIFVFFFALGYQLIYGKITRTVPFSQLAYYGVLPILAYFSIFGLFLFNMEGLITPSAATIQGWKAMSSFGHGFIDNISVWPRVIYYILAETWAVSVTIVFFWQVANKYVTKDERGRFYPAILILCQIASLASGHLNKIISYKGSLSFIIQWSTVIIILASVMLLYANYYFFKNNELPEEADQNKSQKSKGQVAILDVIKRNPKLFLVAMLTVYYGLCSVFMEQFFKSKMKEYAKLLSSQEGGVIKPDVYYNSLNSTYFIIQSRTSMIFAMLGNFIVRNCSWLFGASLTPIIVIIGALLLFSPIVFSNIQFGTFSALTVSVFSGIWIISLFKSLKYASFDPSKEEYIAQQSDENKRETKNLEGILGRAGKSVGALGLGALMNMIPGLSYSSPVLGIGLFIATFAMGGAWLSSAFVLSKDVKERTSKDKV